MYFPLFVGVLCLYFLCNVLLLKRKRKLVALLLLSYRCIDSINVLLLFFTVQWVSLQCVVLVFPHYTHLHSLFLASITCF